MSDLQITAAAISAAIGVFGGMLVGIVTENLERKMQIRIFAVWAAIWFTPPVFALWTVVIFG